MNKSLILGLSRLTHTSLRFHETLQDACRLVWELVRLCHFWNVFNFAITPSSFLFPHTRHVSTSFSVYLSKCWRISITWNEWGILQADNKMIDDDTKGLYPLATSKWDLPLLMISSGLLLTLRISLFSRRHNIDFFISLPHHFSNFQLYCQCDCVSCEQISNIKLHVEKQRVYCSIALQTPPRIDLFSFSSMPLNSPFSI